MKKIKWHIVFVLFLIISTAAFSVMYEKNAKASQHHSKITKDPVRMVKAHDSDKYEPKASDKDKPKKKIIYLTFDDGPSSRVTGEILDTLKKKEVKATFFVVGYKIKGREAVIKRIHDEGNGIGLHSYTHDYKKLYRNNESFIKEMEETENEVYRAAGIRTKIIRFPSGSKKHLDKNLAEELQKRGYKVFDWNACASDGINYRIPPERLYNEAIKSSKKWTKVVLLMHCDEMNKNTCEIMPRIIDYFKDNGYEFKIIDNDTPEYHFRICK